VLCVRSEVAMMMVARLASLLAPTPAPMTVTAKLVVRVMPGTSLREHAAHVRAGDVHRQVAHELQAEGWCKRRR